MSLDIHTPSVVVLFPLLVVLAITSSSSSNSISFAAAAGTSTNVRAITKAKLVAGREHRNIYGDLINYYTFAEEGAVIVPAPAWSLYDDRDDIVDLFDTSSSSNSSSSSGTHRDSVLTWTIMTRPHRLANVTGENNVVASSGNKFVIHNWTFTLAGAYKVRLNTTLWDGRKFTFNRTIVVNAQPQVVKVTQTPEGFNGTALFPPAAIQLESLIEKKVATDTARISFNIVAGPGKNIGPEYYYTDNAGACTLTDVIIDLPGQYVYHIAALLSDGTTIKTPDFPITIVKAYPTRLEFVRRPSGIGRFYFFTQPMLRAYDAKGIVQDDRATVTLRIGNSNPSFIYGIQDPTPVLHGNVSQPSVDYAYTYDNLWINMPGGFDIIAELFINGEMIVKNSYYVVLGEPPTYLPPEGLQINAVGTITIVGSQPRGAFPLSFMISGDENCSRPASELVPWHPEEPSEHIEKRNISIVPYIYGDSLHLCMLTAAQDHASILVQNYQPRFNEPYPYVISFAAADVSQCAPLDGLDVALYKAVGWSDVEEGRQYGCHLTPPVAGTIPPCTCPLILRCAEYRKPFFRPPGLDIGMCVCCTTWVMAVAGIVTTSIMILLLLTIYYYV